ncbi:KH domain-containing protein [Candidatus Woesearchaeota archaeon]|nr:KH domain-containing protein [Candidatus Woesearchaeota archaeon]
MTSTSEFQYELKIPKDRVAVLIGVKGKVKKDIEAATKTKIKIDSEEGDVFISGKDAINLFNAREVVKAVGRGFNPNIAKLLLKTDYSLEVIDIEEYAGTKNHLQRVRGRLIGTEGKARKTIEALTECYISIYGRTVAIIGSVENVALARRAVEGLLKGSKHGNIYKWLEKRRKEIIQKEFEQRG